MSGFSFNQGRHINPLTVAMVATKGELVPPAVLQSTWATTARAAIDVLSTSKDPLRALAELSLGEIVAESKAANQEGSCESARKAFQRVGALITATAYLRLSDSCAAESERTFYLTRAFIGLREALPALAVPHHRHRGTTTELELGISQTCRALVETYGVWCRHYSTPSGIALSERKRISREVFSAALCHFGHNHSVKLCCAVMRLLSGGTALDGLYLRALTTISNLSYRVANVSRLLCDNFRAMDEPLNSGGLPLIIGAAFNQVLSPTDRIMGFQITFPHGSQHAAGDIDLLIHVDKRSRSGFPHGFHALEVKSQNVARGLKSHPQALIDANKQMRKTVSALEKFGIAVHSGVVLYDALSHPHLMVRDTSALVGATLYRVNPTPLMSTPVPCSMQLDKLLREKPWQLADLIRHPTTGKHG